MIAVRSWQRAKVLTRIEFVAGTRALADYRKANKIAREIAAMFSTGIDDAPQLAAQVVEENKELHRRIRVLEELAAGVEAEKLLSSAQTNAEGTRIVTHAFEGRDIEFLKKLAHALIANTQTIVLLGSHDKDTARLVFARSSDVLADMSALMRDACTLLDGRGGGKPDMAQGGGKNVAKLNDALKWSARSVGGS